MNRLVVTDKWLNTFGMRVSRKNGRQGCAAIVKPMWRTILTWRIYLYCDIYIVYNIYILFYNIGILNHVNDSSDILVAIFARHPHKRRARAL